MTKPKKILLTGATGYIGRRLLPDLAAQGHQIVLAARDRRRISIPPELESQCERIALDVLKPESLKAIPQDIDAAYFLVHSMAGKHKNFKELEAEGARHFTQAIGNTQAQQVIYLSGIANAEELSEHLSSRKQVEDILMQGSIPCTVLRAGIIVGSGSASFEIIRDLVEKLPIMVAPKWLNTRSQPIAVRNVLEYLIGVLFDTRTYQVGFDLESPSTLTYKEMLLQFAEVRGLKRHIYTVPVMTPRLSSYWLYFVTSTSYPLAVHLVNSMKTEVVAEHNPLKDWLGIESISYKEAVRMAFDKIQQNQILSSWKDAMAGSRLQRSLAPYIEVPSYGCFKDAQSVEGVEAEKTQERIWSIGGENGWYYMNALWKIRGFIDKIAGGVGLRRGRTHPQRLKAGDALDFWRVILADRKQKRLLLYAEMKLPGEAWLEFSIDSKSTLHQTATFRPKGLAGRFYWYALWPFHLFIFKGMAQRIAIKAS